VTAEELKTAFAAGVDLVYLGCPLAGGAPRREALLRAGRAYFPARESISSGTAGMDSSRGLAPARRSARAACALRHHRRQVHRHHCRTHHRSGFTYLGEPKLLGYPRIRAYAGSWSELGATSLTFHRTLQDPACASALFITLSTCYPTPLFPILGGLLANCTWAWVKTPLSVGRQTFYGVRYARSRTDALAFACAFNDFFSPAALKTLAPDR